MTDYSLKTLMTESNPAVVFRGIAGSHAYGKPVDWYLGLDEHLADTWNVIRSRRLAFRTAD